MTENPPQTRPELRHALSALAIFAVAVACTFLWTERPALKTVARVAAGLTVIAWIYGALLHPQVRAWYRSLAAQQKHGLVAIALLMCVGQLAGKSLATYPLANWHMFSLASRDQTYPFHEVEGLTEEGQRIRLVPGQLFPSVGNHLLLVRLDKVFGGVPIPLTAKFARSRRAAAMHAGVLALAQRHNATRPDTVTKVQLFRTTLDFGGEPGTQTTSRALLYQAEVPTS